MYDYKPNSHRFKQEQALKEKESKEKEKKVGKVVSGKVKTKKKNSLQKVTNSIISEDANNVKSYILIDVLLPAVKKAISDIVTEGIDMLLYGGSGNGKKRSAGSKISYSGYYDRRDDRRHTSSRSNSRYDFDDIILENRGEAEEVLDSMDELLDTYGIVSVADLYDLVGVTCNYTDNKYGWKNLRNAEPVRVRDGYMLKLPKALPID